MLTVTDVFHHQLTNVLCTICLFRMQVESIAPMFKLDPGRPLWIVRKAGNIAVWPRGGKFTGPLVTPGFAYEVKEHVPPASPVPTSLPGSDTRRDLSPPFGIYTSPTCSIAGPSHVKKTWNKSIMIISVRRRDLTQPFLQFYLSLKFLEGREWPSCTTYSPTMTLSFMW